jgi:hypothetical protein
MGSSFKEHVSSLNQSLLHKFIAILCGFAWLSSSSKEYSAFLIFHRHEIRRNLDVYYIRPVGMRSEIVHEEVVGIVDEEVKSVYHLFVVTHQRHFKVLIHYLTQF